MYQGTSLWIWAVQGFVWLCVAALVVAIGLALPAGAALVGLGWLAWRALARAEGPARPARARRAAPFDQRRTPH
jgi:hypothetical protein